MKITKDYLRKLIKEQLGTNINKNNVDEVVSPGFAAGLVAILVAGAAGVKAKSNYDDFKKIMHKVETDKRSYKQLSDLYQQETGNSPEQDRMGPEDLKIYAAAKELEHKE